MTGVHVLVVDGSRWVREGDYRKLERELAEARAALRECASRFVFTYFVPRYAKEWQERHAAALKAAQEDKP